jgi:hypothetical protein
VSIVYPLFNLDVGGAFAGFWMMAGEKQKSRLVMGAAVCVSIATKVDGSGVWRSPRGVQQ